MRLRTGPSTEPSSSSATRMASVATGSIHRAPPISAMRLRKAASEFASDATERTASLANAVTSWVEVAGGLALLDAPRCVEVGGGEPVAQVEADAAR